MHGESCWNLYGSHGTISCEIKNSFNRNFEKISAQWPVELVPRFFCNNDFYVLLQFFWTVLRLISPSMIYIRMHEIWTSKSKDSFSNRPILVNVIHFCFILNEFPFHAGPRQTTVSKRNYCTPYGILLHTFPAMSYIFLMKYIFIAIYFKFACCKHRAVQNFCVQ